MKLRFITTFIITMVLLYIPVVSNIFKSINTMFHEVGHALMTLVTSGKVKSIALFYNTEGVTLSATNSWFGVVLTSIFGYVFTSLMVLFLVYLWKKEKHKTMIVILLAFSVVTLVLWVRNIYGVVWVVGFIAALFFLLKSKKKELISGASFIFVIVMFTQSFQSSLDILILSYVTPDQAGDATNLNKATLIPTILWGIFFFVQSIIFSLISLKLIFKKQRA